MAIAKQVIDFNVSKGFTTAQSDEHQRNWQEKSKEYAAKVGNYDFTRTHLNFEVTKGGRYSLWIWVSPFRRRWLRTWQLVE